MFGISNASYSSAKTSSTPQLPTPHPASVQQSKRRAQVCLIRETWNAHARVEKMTSGIWCHLDGCVAVWANAAAVTTRDQLWVALQVSTGVRKPRGGCDAAHLNVGELLPPLDGVWVVWAQRQALRKTFLRLSRSQEKGRIDTGNWWSGMQKFLADRQLGTIHDGGICDPPNAGPNPSLTSSRWLR